MDTCGSPDVFLQQQDGLLLLLQLLLQGGDLLLLLQQLLLQPVVALLQRLAESLQGRGQRHVIAVGGTSTSLFTKHTFETSCCRREMTVVPGHKRPRGYRHTLGWHLLGSLRDCRRVPADRPDTGTPSRPGWRREDTDGTVSTLVTARWLGVGSRRAPVSNVLVRDEILQEGLQSQLSVLQEVTVVVVFEPALGWQREAEAWKHVFQLQDTHTYWAAGL